MKTKRSEPIKFVVTNKDEIKVYDLQSFSNTVKHFELEQGTFIEIAWLTNDSDSIVTRPVYAKNDPEFKKIKELIISKFPTRQDFLNKYATKQVSLHNEMKYNDDFIKSINNPTEEMKLEVVKLNWRAIKHIANPSEEIQLEAVKQNGLAIQYLNNPTKEVQLEALKQNIDVIQYIKNPTEEMQLAAVVSNSSLIQYIENPSEALQLVAVNKDGDAIKYIKNPSEKLKLKAFESKILSETRKKYDLDIFGIFEEDVDHIKSLLDDPTFLTLSKKENS